MFNFTVFSGVKMVNQLLAGVNLAAAAEAMAFGSRLGLNTRMLFDFILNSRGASWFVSSVLLRFLLFFFPAMALLVFHMQLFKTCWSWLFGQKSLNPSLGKLQNLIQSSMRSHVKDGGQVLQDLEGGVDNHWLYLLFVYFSFYISPLLIEKTYCHEFFCSGCLRIVFHTCWTMTILLALYLIPWWRIWSD